MARIPTVSVPRVRIPALPEQLPKQVIGVAVTAASVGIVVTTGVGGRMLRLGRRALGVAVDKVEDVTDVLDDAAEAVEDRLEGVPVLGAVAGAVAEVTDAIDDAAEDLEERFD